MKKLVSLVVASVLGAALLGPPISLAGDGTPIPWLAPKVPGTKIACYHPAEQRFYAAIHPSRCDVAGSMGGGRQGEFVSIQVAGIRWGHWGVGRTFGALGMDTSTGVRVRLIAWKRIRCDDGSTWYSAVLALNLMTGNVEAVLHPPICGEANLHRAGG
jgi:hypothetical protein